MKGGGGMSKALQHCGCEAKDYANAVFIMCLSTPFEGAGIKAKLFPIGSSRREWGFYCWVENNRGSDYSLEGMFIDCGRYVAKSMLRSMALELRRSYCHRGQKCRKRAIARAKAKASTEGGAK